MRKLLERIGVWGDSLLQGVVLDETQMRYSVLEDGCVATLARMTGIEVRNNSRFGCTAPKGMRALTRALEVGADYSAAVIEFGGNDCDYNWEEVAARPLEEHIPRTPLNEFVHCYEDMITLVRSKGISPVLVSLPPLDAERYLTWVTRNGANRENILTWLGDVYHIYRWHERYSNAVAGVARKFNCAFVDVRDAFLSERDYKKYLCVDGIHPNRDGQKLIEGAFMEVAEELGY